MIPPCIIYIEFRGGLFSETEGLPPQGRFSVKTLRKLTDDFYEESQERHHNRFALGSRMFAIFAELAFRTQNNDTHGRMIQLRQYLAAQYAVDSDAEELSKRFGCHADFLCRLFREQYGITPRKMRDETPAT